MMTMRVFLTTRIVSCGDAYYNCDYRLIINMF